MTTSAGKALGQVKWFNNKSGFGFITVMNGDHNGKDIFVHHSDLLVGEEQYRYLVTGEYVEFKLSELSDDNMKDKDDKHKFKIKNFLKTNKKIYFNITIYNVKIRESIYNLSKKIPDQ